VSGFLKTLHELAQQCEKDFSDEGNPDEPGHRLRYDGQLIGNYPWIYIDFGIFGAVPLEHLVKTEARFRTASEACPELASYLTTTVGTGRMRCRLIYREDIKRGSDQKPPDAL
jgi:hypothetical protein